MGVGELEKAVWGEGCGDAAGQLAARSFTLRRHARPSLPKCWWAWEAGAA